jgi:aspartate 1-decarboxylase
MRGRYFKSKIHRATVTHADLHYEGSVTIDEDLMEAADVREHEAIHVWNITSGSRLETYAIAGTRGSGVICLNGAAAHLNHPGDLVILATFVDLEQHEIAHHCPTVILVDSANRIIRRVSKEVAGPNRRADTESPSGTVEGCM